MIKKSYEIQRNPINLLKCNLFLLYGENDGLRKDIKESIRVALNQKNTHIELLSLYENDIIDREENFYNSIYSGSLFSNKKIISIYDASDKMHEKINEVSDMINANMIVMGTDSSNAKKRTRKFIGSN